MTTQELSRPRHDRDFYAWALDQARRLRELARLRPNEPIDWELLADEVEDMGKSAQRAAESFLKLAIGHLLKIDHAADAASLRHWAKELNAFRKNLRRALSDALEAKLRRELPEIYEVARAEAIATMPLDPELEARTPDTCPYTWEQITGDWLPERFAAPPEPRRRPRRRP